jgi:hypothetical protein
MNSSRIIEAVTSVTKPWAKQLKAEERNRNRILHRRQALIRSARTTLKAAAWECMEAAYRKASNDNTYPARSPSRR